MSSPYASYGEKAFDVNPMSPEELRGMVADLERRFAEKEAAT